MSCNSLFRAILIHAAFGCLLVAQPPFPGQPGVVPPPSPFSLPPASVPSGAAQQMVPPGQVPFKAAPPGGKIVRELVRCNNIRPASAMTALLSMFPPDELHVFIGADFTSPKIEASGQARPLQGSPEPHATKQLILVGLDSTVNEARAMLAQMDRPREQVRLKVKLMEISTEALRKLGISYDFSKYSIRETASSAGSAGGGILNGLRVLQLGHLPISIDATLSALETHNKLRNLAEPSLSILDGERGYILIGQKLLFQN